MSTKYRISFDQSGVAQDGTGDKKKMHDKRNGAKRAMEGQMLRVLKFISETGSQFQPHLHSPLAAPKAY